MLNIKYFFFIMIGLSVTLMFMFNSSLPGLQSNQKKNNESELENLFLTTGGFRIDHNNQLYGLKYEDYQEKKNLLPLETPKEDEKNKIKETEENKMDTVPVKMDEDVSNILEKSKEQIKLQSSEEIKKKVPVKMSKDNIAEINKKINSDPYLTKLAWSYKKLKEMYDNLNKKYKKLENDNRKLKENIPAGNSTGQPNKLAKNQNNLKVATLEKNMNAFLTREKQVQMVLRYSNPFYLLGAYPNITLEYFNSYPDGKPFYERLNYGLHNDQDYCEITDLYNLAHPENIFKRKTFFTDYAKNGLPRKLVMRRMGYDLSPQISKYMSKRIFRSRSIHLDPRITMFFTKRVDLHIYHEIGKHFLCATQMYNHIPGHGVLKRKDMIVDSVDDDKLLVLTHYGIKTRAIVLINKNFSLSPTGFTVLFLKEECQAFFGKINSKEYQEKLKTEPIQFVIKIGFGSHRAEGVFLLDKNQTIDLNQRYRNGQDCGVQNRSLIAQTYVTNPLLLNFQNKFDFRVYMLIASTNPLIVFYHDGFLRVSLHTYDKFSNDRSTHLTNTHLSKGIFAEAKNQNKTLHGMSESELRNYQMWSLERLQEYLLETGVIKDPKWLENYLRPKFKEAFIHIVRMTSHAFWKQSNVFELFGLDFMLDSELNLWFIECNSSPQLIGTNERKTAFLVKMMKDTFDIQYAYYKSRMKRVVNIMSKMQEEAVKAELIDYPKFRKLFAEAWKNKIEPEYALPKDNSFEVIIDKSLEGPAAYFGILKEECIDD